MSEKLSPISYDFFNLVFQGSFNLPRKYITICHICYNALTFVTILLCLWDELLYLNYMTTAESLLFWWRTSAKLRRGWLNFYLPDFIGKKNRELKWRGREKNLYFLSFSLLKRQKRTEWSEKKKDCVKAKSLAIYFFLEMLCVLPWSACSVCFYKL